MSIGLRQFHATLLVHLRSCELRWIDVVVGKNYRLQNIQLSKIRWGLYPQALGSVARRARCPLRFLAESPLTVAVSESVNVGSIGALVLSSAWLAEAAPPHLTVQGRRNDSLNNLPDVGGRETQEASLAHRNSFKDQPAFTLSGFGAATFAYVSERRLVENTGLEPVTSWLQTRRSPS